MHLGEDKVARQERDASSERFPEEVICLGMVLIAPTPQRDPRPAIDEQSAGFAGAAHGMERGALR